ncbi:MAG TPA: helix-turn-helix transcriptional regulator [Phototrophicaceae bacterium]|nr:helix-turn-helix transcriptional regulator [Phototrophicaceae bacterium]
MKNITPLESADRLHIARSYMDRYYAAPLTLEQISGEAGFSPYHFIRLFRSAYRRTPHQYLMQQRIGKAKELLRSTDLPIIDVCYAVGFESLGSFSTLFRREAGLSPSQYRQHTRPQIQSAFVPLCFRYKHGLE